MSSSLGAFTCVLPYIAKGNPMFLKRLSVAFLCALVAVCSGCHRSNSVSSGSAIRNVKIAQWGQGKYLIYLPVYLAQSQGFFEKHNVHADVVFSGNDDQVFATVVRGDAQFGVGDPIFSAISTQRGLPGVEVASIVGRVALWGIGKKIAKQIHSPQDLSGLRIGTFPRPSTTYTLLASTLKQSHVNAQIVEVQIGSELALLESNKVDIVFLLEPDASLAESKGYSVVMSLPALWGKFAFTGLTTTRQYATDNAALTSDMEAALDDAVHFAYNNTAEATADAQKLFPQIDPGVVAKAVARMIAERTLPTSAAVDKDGWSHAIQVREQIGDLKGDSQFLECLWSPR
jgi:NitT/TauT family transport system substrate-binding protein